MTPRQAPQLLRRILRSPRLSLAAVVCIAVGTAATSAALTLVSATLFRPLPFPHGDRLVRIWLSTSDAETRGSLSFAEFVDLGDDLVRSADGAPPALEALEATARARLQFRSDLGTRRVEGEAISAGYLRMLGVEPIVGRPFTADEHRAGGEPVMLLDYRTWVESFAFDEGVVGRSVRTDRGEFTVVGVLPESFSGSVEEDSGSIEFWMPIEQYLSAEGLSDRSARWLWVLGRLPTGAAPAALGARLATLGSRLGSLQPELYAGRTLISEPMGENWRGRIRRGSWLLVAAAGLLLLVAAANVAVLFVAKAMRDRHQFAIRGALGAERWRLVAEAAREPVVLALAGWLLGMIAGPPLLRAFAQRDSLVEGGLLGIPTFVRLEVDPTAVLLSFVTFLATAIIAAVVPAVVASRAEPRAALEGSGRGSVGARGGRRWASALIVVEIALTSVLMIGATLLTRSYSSLTTADLGFRTERLLRLGLFVDPLEGGDREALAALHERVRGELERQPGVERVGAVWPTVPMDWPAQRSVTVPGMAPPDAAHPEVGLTVGLFSADPEFFEVVEIPLRAGRRFDSRDALGGPRVALVSETLARRIAAGLGEEGDLERVVGRELELHGAEAGSLRIVGVVGDTQFGGPRDDGTPLYRHELYLPLAQWPRRLLSFTIATAGDPALLAPPLLRSLSAVAPLSATDWVGPVDRWLTDLYLDDTRFLLSLVGSFSIAALLLSAIGLFALLSDAVARRRAEIGLRQALGATPGRIVTSFVAEGLRLAGFGLAAGGFLALGAGRALGSFVYGVTTSDPRSFVVGGAALVAVAGLASLLPARAAARTHPSEVLREG